MPYCSNCGSELNNDVKFCPKCGTPTNQSVIKTVEEEPKTNRKSLYALLVVLAALLLIVCGVTYYSNSQELKEARLAREQFVKDSLAQARQDSIRLAEQKEKERIESEIALKKRKMLIPFSVVLDMYKHKEDKESIIQKLKEYGYSYFTSYENGEYWTKDVNLEAHKDWRDYTYYEATERKGSSVLIYNEGMGFSISVYSHNDFKDWEKQLKQMGYKNQKYGDDLPGENGWTALGAHGNLCRQYVDNKGNVVEFMKDGDGHPGYDVYSVDWAQ